MSKNIFLILIVSICSFLIACGGSGDSSNPVAPAYHGQVSGKISGEGELGGVPVYLVKTDAKIAPTASMRAQTTMQTQGYMFTVTASDGVFLFSNVPEGDYNIIARKSQYKSAILRNVSVRSQTTTQSTADFLLELTATGDIAGTVEVPAGMIKTGVIVFVTGTSNAAFTAGDGSYKISGVPVGTYSLAFTSSGLSNYQLDNIVVGSAQTTSIPLVTLAKKSSSGGGIVWKGTFAANPTSPNENWAYYNSNDGKAYIFASGSWQIMAEDGATGTQGIAGSNGVSIAWQGALAAAPASPKLNWGYYNSTDKKSYIYNGSAWQILAQDGLVGPQGPVGPQGSAGISITWLGTMGAAPVSPQLNNAYYNSTDKKSYIFDGASWQILAQDGVNGPQGIAGVSVVWQGTLTTAPPGPQLNWAYYNTTDKKSYVWGGASWQIIAQDGSDGVGIVWKGTLAGDPPGAQLNWGYYNSTTKIAYIYDGDSWEVLAESVTGPTGPQGVSIAWQGSSPSHPASPQLNWAYNNTTNGNAYIWDGNSWELLVEGREVDKPNVSNIQVSAGFGRARITWETNEPSTSQVEYGLTTAYTATTTLDTKMTTDHSVQITGFMANTWQFRVRSVDASGNLGQAASGFVFYKSVTYGGTASESARAIVQASDGNFIIAGTTISTNGTFALDGLTSKGGDDLIVLKIDPLGKILWKKRYGGAGNDVVYDMCQHGDGTITICGKTDSDIGGDIVDKKSVAGEFDGWVIHLNTNGDKIWARCLGSSNDDDEFARVSVDPEGGIFLCGTVGGEGSNFDEAYGTNSNTQDSWVVSLNLSGNINPVIDNVTSTTSRLFTIADGSNSSDSGASAFKLPDGGYFSFGTSPFTGTYPTSSASIGLTDMWLARYNNQNALVFQRGFGGAGNDSGVDAVYLPALDKIFLLGQVSQNGRDVLLNPNTYGIWVALANKSDGLHYSHWPNPYTNGRVIRGSGSDFPERAILLADGNVLIVGSTGSMDGDFAGLDDWTNQDAFAMKINVANGSIMWAQKFGGNSFDVFYDAVELSDNSIMFVGQTYSDESAGSTCPPTTGKGSGDVWIVKTDAGGNLF